MLSSMRLNGDDARAITADDLCRDEVSDAIHNIVLRAQDSHDGSIDALFVAYDEYVKEQHPSPIDAALYYSFLLRMQEYGREGEDLMSLVLRVVKEHFGLNGELGDEEVVEVPNNIDATRRGAQASLGRYTRTGSFDSFLDGTADKVAGTDYGNLAVRPRRASQQNAPDGYANKARNHRRATSDTEAHSYRPVQLPSHPKVNGTAPRRSSSGQQPPVHKRSASVSSYGSLRIRRNPTSTYRTGTHDADESDFTDHTASLDLSSIQIPGVNAPIPNDPYDSPHQRRLQQSRQIQHQQYVPEPFRPSDTRLMDDAETFEEQRLHRVTRECIRIWRNRAQERMNLRDDMERAAVAFDRRVLLRASLLQLRDTALVRRSGRETNRFFDRLETRADKARSLFLLTKAFTHWAKCAEDEVQRTSVARRHILRTRFFNGWRDITAVNELKIQHFALAKFLSIWRARAAKVRDRDDFAESYYEQKIVRKSWNALNNEYLNRGAANWHDTRTARMTLQKWREITEIMRERNMWATDRRDGTLMRKTFRTWQQKTVAVKTLQFQADQFRQTSLLRTMVQTLQRQAQLEPLLRQVQARTNGRLLRAKFQDWRKDAQLSRQAHNVDRMRVLRNAYTAWNDRLRIKALEDRINDRIIVECLYKWTLASRVSLFQRVHDRQLKQSTFLSWVTKTNQRVNTLDTAEVRFAQFKRGQLMRTCLRKMEAITTERRREQFAIISQYQQKLKQRIFDKLKERQAHFQELNQWSADARFYVLSKHTLNTWSQATQHARRNRRRDTYSQVRRMVKTNLVRRVFEHWRDKANHIAVLTQRANDVLDNRTFQSSAAIVHQWHDRTLILRQQHAQAESLYAFKLSTRYFAIWSQRMDLVRTLEGQAVALRQESTEIAATGALKKMGWRLWNFQRQEENARALFERNFEKHVRAMVRFWAERATERRGQRAASPSPPSRSRRRRQDDGDDYDGHGNDGDFDDYNDGNNTAGPGGLQQSGDETQRLESWTAFDETALGLNNDLDLSLSLTPEQPPRHPTFTPNPYAPIPSPASTTRPPGSILRRPNTYPQPQSAARPPPATIPEDDESDLSFGDAAQSTFWSGTPLPPPPTTSSKPGYLKTPSKRSVVRAKRPELPPSPEKARVLSPVRRPLGSSFLEREGRGRLGTMSAPPVQSARDARLAVGGVTSFERRLREGGFGGSVAVGGSGSTSAMRKSRGRGGRARVGFGEVSQMGGL
ncbi:Sfi1 spindle body protein-domain-containing protein [Alternaria rosae]|uniref:Sfi1 spindle body protein-domain-containing protein n=1 Tax=Alternaria rosae TaxID=1187941 RepID=UPI001E8DA601|nr:Sfi1 spindle body protein-domain-containing protein [Alternaria rosae]KAH6876103.1 Sfi1 spindle body protein-domain-containing protein [Alternaria rosae]